ncbi:MAG: AAA family ATPase, partial [Spirochaetota bacterium]
MEKVKILEYDIDVELHSGRRGKIYRAIRRSDKKKVVLKTLVEYPSPRDVARINKEYEVLKEIHSAGIIEVLKLETYNESPILVMQDTGGISLAKLLREKDFTLKEKLEIAIKMSESIESIHQQEVIHLDIKPSNIIYNLENKDLHVIDFGISTRLSRENPSITSPENLEGTLAYLSPEQTGRMNRSIDYRADFYSLGITLYELFTGELPFYSDDSMEMLHFHMAVEAQPAHVKSPEVPESISNIIQKLMSKKAEDRYQGGYGIRYDFQQCLQVLQNNGLDFHKIELATRDISEKFQIPQKLYGREQEITQLISSFDRIANGSSELMIIKGYSGIGKSALVNEIHKPIVEKRGYFISGKFDQFKRDIPYSAMILAFQDLVRQLLTEAEEEIIQWKEKILSAVGKEGQLIIDIIPEVEFIIGKQPKMHQLDPIEFQNRLNSLFKQFLKVFATQKHPLVLFIDDMQWADNASLQLTENILSDREIEYLLFICSYRDNEIDITHPLLSTLDEVKKSGCTLATIQLNALKTTDVNLLVAESLKADEEETFPLASLVYEKTNGNPFFVAEFLKSLYQEKLLNFDPIEGKWQWENDKIHQAGITDNVVALMSGKIQKLPKQTQRVLQLASCIGNRFALKTVAIVNEKQEKQTALELEEALKEGIIQPVGDAYKYISGEKNEEIIYCFSHDRVQQAAYSLIPEEENARTHYLAGKHILENTTEKNLEEEIFDIVNHLNRGESFVTTQEEVSQLIKLNLQAGIKAANSAAFISGQKYFAFAAQKLTRDDWDTNYNLAWKIYKEKASCEYSGAMLTECEKTIQIVLPKSKTEDEKVEIYKIYINVLFGLSRHWDSIAVGREALAYMGIKLPKNINKLHLIGQFFKFNKQLKKIKVDGLMDLPFLGDKHLQNICSIIYDLVPSSYIISSDTLAYISLIMANIYIRNGNHQHAPFAYTMAAMVYEGAVKDFKTAYELGIIATKLNSQSKYYSLSVKGRVYFLIANFVLHWARPVGEHLEYTNVSLQANKDVGSLNWYDYSIAFARTQGILFNKLTVEELITQNAEYYNIHLKNKDREVIVNQYFLLEFLLKLKGETENPCDNIYNFEQEEYDKEMSEPGNNTIRTYYFAFSMLSHCMNGEYEKALEYGNRGFKYVFEVLGLMSDMLFRFYYLLAALNYPRKLTASEKSKMFLPYRINKFLMKRYAKHCPENYLPYQLILEAEEAKKKNDISLAIKRYSQAIQENEKRGFHQITALTYELAAKFFFQIGATIDAKTYLINARHYYQKWGATAKVKQIDAEYPDLVKSALAKLVTGTNVVYNEEQGTISITTSTKRTMKRSTTTKMFDFHSVFKASQSLSGEIQFDKLLEKLMLFVLENAGATKGYLLFNEAGQLNIEASGELKNKNIQVLQSIPLKDAKGLSTSIVNYVIRTKENVVLVDAAQEGPYRNEPYIKQNQVQSLLCAPILNKGELSGIIYLENDLTNGAFTRDRVEILQILASQAAISIDNAKLYANIENVTREKTRISTEMEIAETIQTSLLVQQPKIENYEVAPYMKTCDEVGGDYYDVIQYNGFDWLVIGDVSGHGITAGLIMMMVQTAIHTVVSTKIQVIEKDIITLIKKVNLVISENIKKMNLNKYMTLTLFAKKEDKFYFTGLHQDLVIYREKSQSIDLIESRGGWLGLVVNYTPGDLVIDCADYGVPQIRERVFLVGSREG